MKKGLFILLIFCCSLIVFSCSDDEEEYTENTDNTTTTDTTAPTVSSISPTENQSGVSVSDNISVTFSGAMDTTSVTTNTSNTSCSGSFQVSSDSFSTCVKMSSSPSSSNSYKTFTVDPSDNFSGNTYYKIRVTTGVKDSSGNTLSSQYETTNGFVITSWGVLHQDYYWQSDNYESGANAITYCSNLGLSGRTWRVPKWTELKKLCLNPNTEIDVSRGSDNGTLMIFERDTNSPISSNLSPGYSCMCMGYVGGNCGNPSGYCTTSLGCASNTDYTGWSIKCVNDP
jgi:hypothetical protein